MTNESFPENELNLLAYIEALLFVAPDALTPAQLAAVLETPISKIEQALNELERSYTESGSEKGLRLQRYRGRVRLTTAPQAGHFVERLLGLDVGSKLSRAALETLAIIMYRQPITRPMIDSIRGVNSDSVVKTLNLRGLVQELGREDTPGRPILYGATIECLQYFGLSSLSELPDLELDEQLPVEPELE